MPIVFVHGFLGFDYLHFGLRKVYYFRGLQLIFQQQGIPVYFPALPRTGTIAQRAAVLADFLSQLPGAGLHLVGHSMGGLDSRYLIHHLDPDKRVRTLTTIGTPHRGSPIARWDLDTRGPVQWVGQRWWRQALEDLTPEKCEIFNKEVPNRSDVRYESYAGVRPAEEMPPWFRPWARLMDKQGEENDSQVTLSSAKWGNFRGIQRADHLELVGWNLAAPRRSIERPFSHIELYQQIVADIASSGSG